MNVLNAVYGKFEPPLPARLSSKKKKHKKLTICVIVGISFRPGHNASTIRIR